MGKKRLSEMSLEELWKLFPIFLVPHKKQWKRYFKQEKEHLLLLLKDCQPQCIEHIGSTAIPKIWAKDIIDILIVFADTTRMESSLIYLINNGWTIMSRSNGRVSLNKGYTEDSFAKKVFHLHLRLPGDTAEILFRDYLLTNPDVAKDYEELKLSLWKRFEHDRDGYTNAKSAFILDINAKAQEKSKVL